MKKTDCKENAEDSNKAISVTVHLLTYMEAGEVESGISPKLNELNNLPLSLGAAHASFVDAHGHGERGFRPKQVHHFGSHLCIRIQSCLC